MKKIAILLIILMMVSVGFLSGCNENNTKSDDEIIIGIWAYSINFGNDIITESYKFLSNKTLKYTNTLKADNSTMNETINGTWKISDNKLFITLDGQDTIIYDYKFSSDNTKLRIADSFGTILDFIKQ